MLIPGLAETEKGYDAVENAGYLLTQLRNFGFHLILHGHKHTPYHFSEDSYTAFRQDRRPPILIVAGGSASSTQLPGAGQNNGTLGRSKDVSSYGHEDYKFGTRIRLNYYRASGRGPRN